MNLLSIVGKKPEKNEKAHIQGAHLKNEKGLEKEWGSGHAKCLIICKKSFKNDRFLVVDSNNKCNVILVVGIFVKHLIWCCKP
jgi:hypothetical protein